MLRMSGVALLPTVASRRVEDLRPGTHIEALKVFVNGPKEVARVKALGFEFWMYRTYLGVKA